MKIEVRKIKESEIYDAAEIVVTGWQTAYRNIIDESID